MMKYIKIKRLIAYLFFINIIFFASNVYAQEDGIESILTQILTKVTSIDILIMNEFGRNTSGSIKNILESNNTLLKEVKTYIISIDKYVKDIYFFLVEPQEHSYDPVRYLSMYKIEQEIQPIEATMSKSMHNLIQYGIYSPEVDEEKLLRPPARGEGPRPSTTKDAYNRPATYSTGGRNPLEYSTTSAYSFYGTDAYENEAQQKAARDFVKNVVANIPVRIPGKVGSPNETVLKQSATQKTMLAIQSMAASNFIDSYVARIRIPIADEESKSKVELLKEMNIADPSSEDYWTDGIGSKGILPRAFAFFNSFFVLNYNLNQITKQLTRINLQLSMLVTQNTIMSNIYNEMIGKMSTFQRLRGITFEGLREQLEEEGGLEGILEDEEDLEDILGD